MGVIQSHYGHWFCSNRKLTPWNRMVTPSFLEESYEGTGSEGGLGMARRVAFSPSQDTEGQCPHCLVKKTKHLLILYKISLSINPNKSTTSEFNKHGIMNKIIQKDFSRVYEDTQKLYVHILYIILLSLDKKLRAKKRQSLILYSFFFFWSF